MTEPLKNTDRPKANIKKVDKPVGGPADQLQPKEPTVLTRGEDTGPTDKQDSNIDPEGNEDEAEFVEEEDEYVPPTAEELPQDSLNVAAHNQLRKL
jgi:hypothetical protein